MTTPPGDGVHATVPREHMSLGARKLRDTYARKPGIPLFKREFGFYCLERWKEQGLPAQASFETLFDYDPPGNLMLGQAGGCRIVDLDGDSRNEIVMTGYEDAAVYVYKWAD